MLGKRRRERRDQWMEQFGTDRPTMRQMMEANEKAVAAEAGGIEVLFAPPGSRRAFIAMESGDVTYQGQIIGRVADFEVSVTGISTGPLGGRTATGLVTCGGFVQAYQIRSTGRSPAKWLQRATVANAKAKRLSQ